MVYPRATEQVSEGTMLEPGPTQVLCCVSLVAHVKGSVSSTGCRHMAKCDRGFESTQILCLTLSLCAILLRGMPGAFFPYHMLWQKVTGEQQSVGIMLLSNQLHSIYSVADTKCFVYIRSFHLTMSVK